MSRAAVRTLHLVLGLSLGAVAALTGLTGAGLAFHDELDRLAAPGLYQARSTGPSLPPDALVARAQAAVPARPVSALIYPPHAGETAQIRFRGGGRAYVNPATGEVQGVRPPDDFWHGLEDIHRHLFLGDFGSQLVAAGAMALLVLMTSGLVLWSARRGRRRFAWKVPAGAPAAAKAREWHSVLGFYASFALVLSAWTGMTFTHREIVEGLYARATGVDLTRLEPPAAPASPPGAAPASLVAVVAAAQGAFPAAEVRAVSLAAKPGRPHRVLLRQPGELDPGGLTTVYLDPASARVLSAIDPRSAPLAWTLSRLNFALHTGAVGGLPMKAALAAGALTPLFFYVSGFLMWRAKRRAQAGRKPAVSAPAPASRRA